MENSNRTVRARTRPKVIREPWPATESQNKKVANPAQLMPGGVISQLRILFWESGHVPFRTNEQQVFAQLGFHKNERKGYKI
jgi:hypothetical protein